MNWKVKICSRPSALRSAPLYSILLHSRIFHIFFTHFYRISNNRVPMPGSSFQCRKDIVSLVLIQIHTKMFFFSYLWYGITMLNPHSIRNGYLLCTVLYIEMEYLHIRITKKKKWNVLEDNSDKKNILWFEFWNIFTISPFHILNNHFSYVDDDIVTIRRILINLSHFQHFVILIRPHSNESSQVSIPCCYYSDTIRWCECGWNAFELSPILFTFFFFFWNTGERVFYCTSTMDHAELLHTNREIEICFIHESKRNVNMWTLFPFAPLQ